MTLLFMSFGYTEEHVMQWQNYAISKDYVEYGGVTISFNCIKDHNKTCQAESVLKKIKQGKKINLDLTGGKNPIKTLCFESGGITSVYKLMNNKVKKEDTFCDFRDNSSIRAGDLWRAYLQD